MAEGINKNLQKQNKVDNEKKVIVNELKEIEAQINNIITVIASGFIQEEFKMKMDELKELHYKIQ